MGLCLRLLGFTISRLVPPYLDPVLGCQRYHTILPCSAPEGAPEAMGMCRGFGVAFLPGNSIKPYTTTTLSRCPHWVRDSRQGQSAPTRLF